MTYSIQKERKMFNWLLGERKKNFTDNNRSLINPDFVVSEDTYTVGIYVSDKERVILMESRVDRTRKMLKYEGDINLIPDVIDQPLLWDWTLFETNNLHDKIGEFAGLRFSARTIIDFQLTTEQFEAFKDALDKRPSIVSQNPFDQSIHEAAAAIGKIIYLHELSDDFCCIS